MKIFPYSLIRLGGDSMDNWSVNETQSITEEVDRVRSQKLIQQKKKQSLCEKLLDFIKDQDDHATRNLVQNLRRDLFNERKLKNSKLRKGKEVLPPELNDTLDDYLDFLENIKESDNKAEGIYEKEVLKCRESFKKVVNSEGLKKGLILSSRSLLNRLESYYDKPIEAYRKKEFKTEQSLLQYISRMYAKTSPFSTFTNLSTGKLHSDTNGINLNHKKDAEGQVKSHIRLNNYLFKYIFDLLLNYRDAYLWFLLRNNPTIQNREDHFLYLTNNNNVESFQRVPFNQVVDHIKDIVAEDEKGIRFNELIKRLSESIDASHEDLEAYIKQLIDYGFLEYNLGVSGIDPDWNLALVKTLKTISENNVNHIDTLIDTLTKLRSLGDKYADENVEGRQKILKEAFDIFRQTCMSIHKAAGLPEEERKTEEERIQEAKIKKEEQKKKKEKDTGESKDEETVEKENSEKQEEVVFKHETSTFFTFKPEQIFYEDTTREVNALMNKSQIEDTASELYTLLNQIRQFRGQLDEKDKMTTYFKTKYGTDKPVDLLTFYEDYFREFKKPEKEKIEKKKKEAEEALKKKKEKAQEGNDDQKKPKEKENVGSQKNSGDEEDDLLPSIKSRNENQQKWMDAFKEVLSSSLKDITSQEVNIGIEPVKTANKKTACNDVHAKPNSYGSFVQYYEENGELKAVINATFTGYGKMMSRFLPILDEKITSEIKDWNNKLSDESSIFIEDCDASYFNANLHPTLMPYEIWMPGGHNTLPTDKQLPITDFEVMLDKKNDEIILIHKPSQKRAFVFDLGFQGHMGRSQLFQLLEKFSKAEYLFHYPIIRPINQLVKSKNEASDNEKQDLSKVVAYPRVTYKDKLILQRKNWIVPKAQLPTKGPMETNWQYYKNVNLWRKEHQMPEEVFVYVNDDRWGSTIDPELTKKLTRDDYKPQYINFNNPLMVNLLEKLIDRVPQSMKVVEMLPNSEQMLKIDDKKYVSEFVVQWYNFN